MAQIAIRLSDAELAAVDRAIKAGHFKNRAEAVRAGLRLLQREVREQIIERSYHDAYKRSPLTPDEQEALDAAATLASELP
jgi:Arc/MetJ-type ribon-helix-helix transcriptional regulator